MEIYIYIAAIVCILIGYIAARIEFNKKLPSIRTKSYNNGFGEGFHSAFEDAGEVRRAYMYHFGNRP